jgi:hypothetical protein
MTPTRLKDLAASAAGRRFRSEGDVNRWLQEQGIVDSETRIAVKHQLLAQGLATDDQPPLGTMRTDLSRHTPETTPLGPEMRALFRKAGLDPARSYSSGELNDLLDRAGLDPVSRMSIKLELDSRHHLRAAGARPSVQAGHDMSAKAERPQGRVLTDRQGHPLVLRSRPA